MKSQRLQVCIQIKLYLLKNLWNGTSKENYCKKRTIFCYSWRNRKELPSGFYSFYSYLNMQCISLALKWNANAILIHLQLEFLYFFCSLVSLCHSSSNRLFPSCQTPIWMREEYQELQSFCRCCHLPYGSINTIGQWTEVSQFTFCILLLCIWKTIERGIYYVWMELCYYYMELNYGCIVTQTCSLGR